MNWEHSVLAAKNYMLVYDAILENRTEIPLSSGYFQVKKPFEVSIHQVVRPRILVWSICRANANLATQVLDEMQVYYTIVNNRWNFMSELKSGKYNTYIILDNLHPLIEPEDLVLASEIAAGKGLISTCYFNGDTCEPLGIFGAEFKGPRLPGPYTVECGPDSIFGETSFSGCGLTQRLKLTSGYEEATLKICHWASPGVVVNQYQDGKALLFAFDLRNINSTSAVDLLRKAVEIIVPEQEVQNNITEIELIINSDISIKGKLEELLPAGSEIVWSQPVPVIENNTTKWEFTTVPGQEQTIRLLLKLPEETEDTYLTTDSYFLVDEDYYQFDSMKTLLLLP